MATVRIVRFSKPGCLRHIDPPLFLELLGKHSGFFARNKISLPATPDPEQIPYEVIAGSFMRLDAEQDKDLIEALYYLDVLSSESEADVVLEKAEAAEIPLPDTKPHPVDLVVRVWLHAAGPELLRGIQDSLEVRRFRSFQFFQSDRQVALKPAAPTPAKLEDAGNSMRPAFGKRKRGEECKITMFEESE